MVLRNDYMMRMQFQLFFLGKALRRQGQEAVLRWREGSSREAARTESVYVRS